MYTSNYTDRKVTASQYIAEICCERKAKKDGTKLWKQFWNDKAWNTFFKRQCGLAKKLLGLYSDGTILQGMNKVKWAWSLATPALISEIEKINASEKQRQKESSPDNQIEIKMAENTETTKKTLFDLI